MITNILFNKRNMNKNFIVGVLIGACIATTTIFAISFLNIRKQVNEQGQVLNEVVQFLNRATNQNPQASTVQPTK